MRICRTRSLGAAQAFLSFLILQESRFAQVSSLKNDVAGSSQQSKALLSNEEGETSEQCLHAEHANSEPLANIAGATVDAACIKNKNAWAGIVAKSCGVTAEKERVLVEGVGDCCMCPEGSAWSHGSMVCKCSIGSEAGFHIVPSAETRQCPTTVDEYVWTDQKHGRRDTGAIAEIMKQRNSCEAHRALEEMSDASVESEKVMRMGMDQGMAVTFGKIKMSDVNIKVIFEEKGSDGVYVTCGDNGWTLHNVLEDVTFFVASPVPMKVKFSRLSYDIKITGSESMSRIFQYAGPLTLKVDISNFTFPPTKSGFVIKARDMMISTLKEKVMAKFTERVFTIMVFRLFSISLEGPLTMLFQGRSSYPMVLNLRSCKVSTSGSDTCMTFEMAAGHEETQRTIMPLQSLGITPGRVDMTMSIGKPMSESAFDGRPVKAKSWPGAGLADFKDVAESLLISKLTTDLKFDLKALMEGNGDPTLNEALQYETTPEEKEFQNKILGMWHDSHRKQIGIMTRLSTTAQNIKSLFSFAIGPTSTTEWDYYVISMASFSFDNQGGLVISSASDQGEMVVSGEMVLSNLEVNGLQCSFFNSEDWVPCSLTGLNIAGADTGGLHLPFPVPPMIATFTASVLNGKVSMNLTMDTPSWVGGSMIERKVKAPLYKFLMQPIVYLGKQKLIPVIEKVVTTIIGAAGANTLKWTQLRWTAVNEVLKLDIQFQSPWEKIGILTAHKGATPPANDTNKADPPGHAWDYLARAILNETEAAQLPSGLAEPVDVQPGTWTDFGADFGLDRVMRAMNVQGFVDLQSPAAPIHFHGSFDMSLHNLARRELSDLGMTEKGSFVATFEDEVEAGKEKYEAILSCGALYLKTPGGIMRGRLFGEEKLSKAWSHRIDILGQTLSDAPVVLASTSVFKDPTKWNLPLVLGIGSGVFGLATGSAAACCCGWKCGLATFLGTWSVGWAGSLAVAWWMHHTMEQHLEEMAADTEAEEAGHGAEEFEVAAEEADALWTGPAKRELPGADSLPARRLSFLNATDDSCHHYSFQDDTGKMINFCIADGKLQKGISYEIKRAQLMREMIEGNGNLSTTRAWSSMGRRYTKKNKPFTWIPGRVPHGHYPNAVVKSISERCSDEVRRCQGFYYCGGVAADFEVKPPRCWFLSTRDVSERMEIHASGYTVGRYIYKQWITGRPETWGAPKQIFHL